MALDVTAEVGKKVKSAIKAKLTELGAYVDDELPDYIMILVGNKKTKDQMDDDLSLFLGHNTERFTSWLHHVLQKLNAASVLQKDVPKQPKEKEKKKEEEDIEKRTEVAAETEPIKAPEEKKKHKKKKDKSERKKEKKEKKKKKDKDKDKEKHGKSHKKEKRAQAASEQKAAEANSAAVSEAKSSVTVPSEPLSKNGITAQETEKKEPSVESAVAQDEEEDLHDDVVDLRPDAEDLALGLEDEPVVRKIKMKTQTKETEVKEKTLPAQNSTPMLLKSIEIKVDNPGARESSKRVSDGDSPEREVGAPSVHDRLGPLPAQSSSPLGKRIINLREESSFPSSHGGGEAMGRVVSNAIASAVKSVSGLKNSEGKPSKKLEARVRPLPSSKVIVEEEAVDDVALPPTRVVSAVGAVFKRSQNSASARVRPMPSSQITVEEEEEVDDVALPPVRVVSAVGAVLKRSHNNDDSDETEEPSTKRIAGVASKVEVAPRPRRPGSMQANTALILRAVADAHKSVNKPVKRALEEKEEERGRKEIYSRSYQERQNQRLNSGASEAKAVKKFAITVPNAFLKDRMDLKLADKQTLGESLIEMEEEYISEEDSVKSEKILPQQKAPAVTKGLPMEVEDPSGSTRFIVTLDGFGNEVTSTDLRSRLSGRPVSTPSIEEEELIEEIEEWVEDVEEMEGDAPQGGIAPQRMASAATTAIPVASNTATKWKKTIDTSGLATKKEERCRFWPACKEGAACQYIHPSKPCNTFPNCRFADKCIYIHPNCKFDSACTKPNCPFTHASSRTIALAQAATVPLKQKMAPIPAKKMMMCRYYPKCVDMNCVFYHPKQVCRYGSVCRTPGCIYIHPEVTTGSLLKWTAPKQPSSTSAAPTAAVSTSTVAVATTAPTLTTIAKPKAPISAV